MNEFGYSSCDVTCEISGLGKRKIRTVFAEPLPKAKKEAQEKAISIIMKSASFIGAHGVEIKMKKFKFSRSSGFNLDLIVEDEWGSEIANISTRAWNKLLESLPKKSDNI